jgi:hypothetical protein
MSTRRATLLAALVAIGLSACALERQREQIREGVLTRGIHREAFLKEWGPPTQTYTMVGRDPVLKVGPWTQSWGQPVYEIWAYPSRTTCLVFDGVRLVAWQTDRTDCEPKTSPQVPEAGRLSSPPPPLPYPPPPPP